MMFLLDDTMITLETDPQEKWLPRPNPELTGIRYMMTRHGCSIRSSWPLPPTSEKSIDSEVGSCEGCKKARFTFVGHRQRAGLWIYLCMEHERIVGFHIMPDGEGRRDGIVPPYRFMQDPPEALFGDFVCGWEETAMNTLPEFYKSVQFIHDVFHGSTHKCSERFEGKRLGKFASINTSLMEQVNSFLQPLRGVVKSGTTKVRTIVSYTFFFYHSLSIDPMLSPALNIHVLVGSVRE